MCVCAANVDLFKHKLDVVWMHQKVLHDYMCNSKVTLHRSIMLNSYRGRDIQCAFYSVGVLFYLQFFYTVIFHADNILGMIGM